MARYDNGELITKERMEDEEWYYTLYQPFLEIVVFSNQQSVQEMMDGVAEEWRNLMGADFPNQEQLLRWCVLHASLKSTGQYVWELEEKLATLKKQYGLS